MERKSAALPQSNYYYSLIDPSQPIEVECRESGRQGTITLSRQDAIRLVQWAYPDVVYFNASLPNETTDVFPVVILKALHQRSRSIGYDYYEVRFSEPHEECFLMGVKNSMRFPLAQWRNGEDVRSLRMIIDDAAPLMHQFITRHGRWGRLSIFLLVAALVLFCADARLGSAITDKALLHYAGYLFLVAAGYALIWFFLNYRKYLGATTIIMVENIEDDPVGGVVC